MPTRPFLMCETTCQLTAYARHDVFIHALTGEIIGD